MILAVFSLLCWAPICWGRRAGHRLTMWRYPLITNSPAHPCFLKTLKWTRKNGGFRVPQSSQNHLSLCFEETNQVRKYKETHDVETKKRLVKSGTNYAKLGTEGQIGLEQLGGGWMSICIKSHQGQVRLVYGHCGRWYNSQISNSHDYHLLLDSSFPK